ncbi:MAG: hypothetical protein ACK5QX_07420 [bacterium]
MVREKTDLKTLILASKNGKRFRARRRDRLMDWMSEYYFSEEQKNAWWDNHCVIAEWEVEWIKEPLKWEGIVTTNLNGRLIVVFTNKDMRGKRFNMTLEEIQEADHAE